MDLLAVFDNCLPSEIPCVVKRVIAQHQGYKDAWDDNVTQA